MAELQLTEERVSHDPSDKKIVVQLFVAGDSPSSRRAKRAIETFFEQHDEIESELEIVDVLREPARALEHNLLATPTLVIETGDETNRYVGDIYDSEDLRAVLAIKH